MNWGDPVLPPRFWAKVMPEPNSGCWLWTGAVSGGNGNAGSGGYGVYWLNGRNESAHIVTVPFVPSGFERDHKCRNRLCCNPLHIDVVPHQVNVVRGASLAADNARKAVCPRHGVPYRGKPRRDGSRVCNKCSADTQVRYRRRKKTNG